MRLAEVRALGFDGSTAEPFTKAIRLRCSQCEALAINGVPTHEAGCSHAVHECAGCNALVPMRVKYCEDCR